MATTPATTDYLLDQLRSGGADVAAKKMFGEYGLYLEGKMVALVCDDRLFVKPVPGTAGLLEGAELASPYPGAKALPLVEGERWEDAEWLGELFRITAAELPAAKVKPARSKKPRSSRA